MKKILPLLLALALALGGCRNAAPARNTALPSAQDGAELSAGRLLERLLAACPEGEREGLERVPQEELAVQVEGFYGLDEGTWEDAAIVRSGGAGAFEVAVIVLDEGAGEEDASAVMNRLSDYLTARQGDFTGYAPDQAELAGNGQALCSGRYLALVVSEGSAAAADAFFNSFAAGTVTAQGPATGAGPETDDPDPSGRYPFTDPGLDDMTLYDTSAILSAWESGDRSGLSGRDRKILEAAEAVLEQSISDGMSGYERERALYGWVVSNIEYDWDHQDPSAVMDPDSANPYGGLVNGKSICLGFATTFQLLMDMAGVECITVTGAAFRSTENHAWNMVRLNGSWYCVDATWDMNVPDPRYWSYFNVTSDWMAQTDHQWDYDAVPEATAQDGGRG